MLAHLELIRRITSGDCKPTLVSSCKKKAIFQRVVRMKLAFLTVDARQDRGDYTAPAPSFESAPEALLRGFVALPELEVHVISCAQKPLKSPDKLAENIWLHSLYVPKPGWVRTSYQGCSRAVRRKLKIIRPDLVHGHGTSQECAVSAVFSKFPNVLTIHANMRLIARLDQARPMSLQSLAAQLETITLPRTRGVICPTPYVREAVKDLARKTWLAPNAVDASFFDLPREPADPPVILCVGNICHRNNQNSFIRALDLLAPTRPFKLAFLGHAPREDPVAAAFFELLATRPWCEYAGFVDRKQLKGHLQRASLLARPSLEDNCPASVLEAMAAGVPVLAAKAGGLPDLIEDGVTGLLSDPFDPASMRAGVSKLLDDASLARTLADKARQQARECHHPLVVARRHFEIYQEILSGHL
jgi:glycosyltransferase involved in cell wall biosynthesis